MYYLSTCSKSSALSTIQAIGLLRVTILLSLYAVQSVFQLSCLLILSCQDFDLASFRVASNDLAFYRVTQVFRIYNLRIGLLLSCPTLSTMNYISSMFSHFIFHLFPSFFKHLFYLNYIPYLKSPSILNVVRTFSSSPIVVFAPNPIKHAVILLNESSLDLAFISTYYIYI